MNQIGNMVATSPDDGHAGRVTQPTRKWLNHRGPLSINVSSAWYFITICADSHAPWIADEGRAVAPRPPHPTTSLEMIAPLILREARENHNRGIWWLALFLVMPDHLHFIVNIGGRGVTALPAWTLRPVAKVEASFLKVVLKDTGVATITGTLPDKTKVNLSAKATASAVDGLDKVEIEIVSAAFPGKATVLPVEIDLMNDGSFAEGRENCGIIYSVKQ